MQALSGTMVTIIAVALILCVTILTAVKAVPTELTAGIFGALSTSIALILQRNSYVDAVKKASMAPKGSDL